MLRKLLVDDPCRDFFGQRLGPAPFEQAVPDVRILALALGTPGFLRQDRSLRVVCGRVRSGQVVAAARRSRVAQPSRFKFQARAYGRCQGLLRLLLP